MVHVVHSKEEFHAVMDGAGDKLVVVNFKAMWSDACRPFAPFFQKVAQDNPDVIFIKVDVDEVPEVTLSYCVRAMPTIIFIKNGETVSEIPGADPVRLLAEVAQHK